MRSSRAGLVLLPLVALQLGAAQAAAQDAMYRTATRMKFEGALGALANVAARLGGGSLETIETTYVKDDRMRIDTEESSTILDLGAGSVIFLDHEQRTYSTTTFDSLAAAMQRATGQVEAERSEAPPPQGEAQAELEFRIATERPGERRTINGFDAERIFLFLEMDAKAAPEGEAEMQEAGTLVFFMDMWMSDDVPGADAVRGFQGENAEAFRSAGFGQAAEALARAFSQDPRVKVAFEDVKDEARSMEGVTVLETTYVVAVPPGMSFDRQALLEAEAAREEQSASSRVGGIAGRILGGLGRQQPPPQEEETPRQSTLLTVTSELREASGAALPESLFEIPAGYREVQPQGMGGR